MLKESTATLSPAFSPEFALGYARKALRGYGITCESTAQDIAQDAFLYWWQDRTQTSSYCCFRAFKAAMQKLVRTRKRFKSLKNSELLRDIKRDLVIFHSASLEASQLASLASWLASGSTALDWSIAHDIDPSKTCKLRAKLAEKILANSISI